MKALVQDGQVVTTTKVAAMFDVWEVGGYRATFRRIMYAYIQNNQVERTATLPKTWKLTSDVQIGEDEESEPIIAESGATVSNFHNLPSEAHKAEGWLPIVEPGSPHLGEDEVIDGVEYNIEENHVEKVYIVRDMTQAEKDQRDEQNRINELRNKEELTQQEVDELETLVGSNDIAVLRAKVDLIDKRGRPLPGEHHFYDPSVVN